MNEGSVFKKIGEIMESLNDKVEDFSKYVREQNLDQYDLSSNYKDLIGTIDFEPNPLIELAKLQYEELKCLNNEIKDLKERLNQVEVDKVKQEKKNKTFQWILGLTITFIGAALAYFIALIL